jgi:phage gpG-like protein
MNNTFVITVDASVLEERLRKAPAEMRRALVVAAQRLAITAQRKVKGEKLSGQVLHVRTGTLRRSINQEVTETEDGVFATIGTNVRYAAIHEYGFDGQVNVRSFLRKGREVRAHVRNVHLPERSFLRSTLRDMESQIREDLKRAALKVLN